MNTLDHHLKIAVHEHLGTQACLVDDSIVRRMSRVQHPDLSETITLDGKPILRFWLPEIRLEGNRVICDQRFIHFKNTLAVA